LAKTLPKNSGRKQAGGEPFVNRKRARYAMGSLPIADRPRSALWPKGAALCGRAAALARRRHIC
jgi:hypothetical protein